MKCSTFQEKWSESQWLTESEGNHAPNDAPNDALHQHLGECSSCQELTQVYREGVTSFTAATESAGDPAQMPAYERMRGAMREGQRQQQGRQRARQWWWFALPAAALAGLMLWFAPIASDGGDGPLRVFNASGVSGYTLGSDWTPLVRDVRIGAGGVVETGHLGEVSIGQQGVGRVKLDPNSRVTVFDWTADKVTLKLAMGTVSWRLDGDSQAIGEIRTPLAIMSGAGFSASHDDTLGTSVEATTGPVQVTGLSGEAMADVARGERFEVPGRAPESAAKVALPAAKAPRVAATKGSLSTAPVPIRSDSSGPAPVGDGQEATPRAKIAGPAKPRVRFRPRPPKSTTGPKAIAEPRAASSGSADKADKAVAAAKVEPREPTPAHAVVPSVGEVVAAASKLMAAGEDSQAVTMLKAASLRAPTYRVLRALGDAHRLAGDAAASASAYRRAIAKASGRDAGSVVMDLAAVLHGKLGRSSEAVEVLQGYLAKRPSGGANGEARWRLSKMQPADAELHWRGILDHAVGSAYAPLALERLGRRLLGKGASTSATKLFTRFLKAKRSRLAETALVGMMHVHHRAGAATSLRRLWNSYKRRFPNGRRSAEVGKLVSGLQP